MTAVAPPTLETNSFVDPNIGTFGIALWNRHCGGMTSAVQILVRPNDIRCDESGQLPGERFVMLTLTLEELKELVKCVQRDWDDTVAHCGDPNEVPH
jgi:hypothetical protein